MSHSTETPADLSGAHLTFWGLLRSEWIKLTTVRSTLWCYGILAFVLVGLAVLIAWNQAPNVVPDNSNGSAVAQLVPPEAIRQAALTSITAGLGLAELVAAVLGALIITSEFATGMIRSTFTAAPRRLGVIAAKALILAAASFLVTLIALAIATGVTEAFFAASHISFDPVAADLAMPVLGGAVYVTMIALLAFGAGLLIRNTAGSISTVLALLLVVPVIFNVLYTVLNLNSLGDGSGQGLVTWPRDIAAFLPSQAGGQLYASGTAASVEGGTAAQVVSSGIQLNGWEGFGVLAAWVVVVGGAATFLAKRRDA